MERIDIVVDPDELARNEEKAERLRKTRAFERTDRVPVLINTNQWTALAARGRTAGDYVRSPVDNLREQILNMKWRFENIRDDQPIPNAGPRGFHNCGNNAHLLDIIRDELKIRSHSGFGPCVDPAVLAEKMAGRVVLTGGPEPLLIRSGSSDRILEASRMYIETLGKKGGYILSSGGGVVPGTPVENYPLLMEASKQLGCVMMN